MADNDHEDQDAVEQTVAASTKADRMNTSQMLLPRAILEAAADAETLNRWQTEPGFCLLVKAPSAEWVAPLDRYLRVCCEWDVYHARTTAHRSGEDPVATQTVAALSWGRRVFAVSQEPSRLFPAALISAADHVLELRPPTAEVVSSVIEAVTGEKPSELTDTMVSRLSFAELAACIRSNSSSAQCVARLSAALAQKSVPDKDVGTAPLIEDLHGYGEAKDWALDLIADVQAWREGELSFDQMDRHVVLSGAPGLGKTQFARSLARSTGLPLFSTSMSQWFANGPGYLDSVIKQIDASFASARAIAPAVMLIDELDAIPDRLTLSPRHREWWTPVVSHILMTLDGAISGQTAELVIVGATNFPERCDAALMRPGRLSRHIKIGLPNEADIAGILRHHLGSDLADDDLKPAAQLAVGGTGADAMHWVKTAKATARRARRTMTMSDLIEAISPQTERRDDLEQRIAVHEAGHAVVAHLLGYRIKTISLRARGSASGYVNIGMDLHVATRVEIERFVVQLLAGRAAEEVVFGSPGIGASSDLALATQQVGRLHLSIGLGDTLLYRTDVDGISAALDRLPSAAAAVEAELQRHYTTALEMVRQHEPLIHLVSEAARKSGYLIGPEFLLLVESAELGE